jgi:hypothetical protein
MRLNSEQKVIAHRPQALTTGTEGTHHHAQMGEGKTNASAPD